MGVADGAIAVMQAWERSRGQGLIIGGRSLLSPTGQSTIVRTRMRVFVSAKICGDLK
ncbi:MAG: hypothetical protein AAGA67_03265 [Cyanobacteria bacterium P01_F01_bin.153]